MPVAKPETMGALALRMAAQAIAAPKAARMTGEKLARSISREFKGAMRSATRGYDAAAVGRNTAGWRTTGSSADAEIAGAGPLLRDRSRELNRNEPNAHKILSAFVNNAVGSGIRVSFDNKKAQKLWDQWITECDTAHGLDFYGLTWLVAMSAAESGEVLARKRPRMVRDKLTVPLQVEVMEGDFIASYENRMTENGGRVVSGIEFDPIGRRTGYWLYPYHPGDAFGPVGVSGLTPKVIPAADIAHVYEATRPGQTRGVPMLAAIMRVAHDLNMYDSAHLKNKTVQSFVCAVVTNDDPLDEGFGVEFAGSPTDGSDPVRGLESGAVILARGGKQVAFNNPTQTSGYSEFKVDRKHDIAAGGLTPYELATGDLSRVNYSSIRAGLIEYRRLISSWRDRVLIPLWVKVVVGWFLDAAIAAGALAPGNYAFKCHAPKFEEVDRLKEALANRQLLENGERSLTDIIRSNGDDPATVMDERVEDAKAARKNGLPVPGVPVPVSVAQTNAEASDNTAENQDAADNAETESKQP